MNTQNTPLDGLKTALQEGCKVRAFLSGGGLRVVRIEKEDTLKGYGEHPSIEEALEHADEDYKAGGRPYASVYGPQKTHYLTGSCQKTSDLDGWILKGSKFEAWQEGEVIFFKLCGVAETHPSQEIVDRVLSTGRATIWKSRGYTFRSYKTFIGNSPAVSTEVVVKPKESRSKSNCWMYHISKTGQGSDFWEACQNAFQAEEAETSED